MSKNIPPVASHEIQAEAFALQIEKACENIKNMGPWKVHKTIPQQKAALLRKKLGPRQLEKMLTDSLKAGDLNGAQKAVALGANLLKGAGSTNRVSDWLWCEKAEARQLTQGLLWFESQGVPINTELNSHEQLKTNTWLLDGPEAKRTVRLQCIESLVERFSYRKKCDHACTAIAEMAQAWSIDQVKESRVHLHEWIETIGRLIHEDQGMYLMRLVPYLLRAGSVANDPFWMQVAQLILDLDYRDTHALSELKDSLCEQSKLRKIPVSLSSIFVAYFIGLDDLSGMLAAIKVSREPLTSLPLKAISPLDVTWPEAMRSWAPHQKNISMIHAALACSKGLLPGGTFSHMDCFRALCLVPDALRAAQLNPTPWALADRSLKELRLLAAEHPWLLAADKKGRNFLHVWGAHPRHPKQMAGDLKALLVHPLSGWSDAADNTGQLGFHSALSACSTVDQLMLNQAFAQAEKEKIKAQMPTVKRKQYGMSTKKRL